MNLALYSDELCLRGDCYKETQSESIQLYVQAEFGVPFERQALSFL